VHCSQNQSKSNQKDFLASTWSLHAMKENSMS